MPHFNASLSKISFFVTVKLIEYIFSAVNICFNLCVGPFPRTNMFFSYYQYEQKNSCQLQKLIHLDQIHYQEMKSLIFYQIQVHNQNIHTFQYLRFLSKQLHRINNVLVLIIVVRTKSTKFINNINVYIFLWVYVSFDCFKQLPANLTFTLLP